MEKEDIIITCSDGYELAASLYQPTDQLNGAIMIAPATGIKRGFYQGISSHLQGLGHGVITYDNRGIGDSLHGWLSDSQATIQQWGELDQTAVLEALKEHFPDTKYHLIGHSAGGQLIGLMSNWSDLTSVFNYASSSGRLANMRFPFWISARFFMNVFIPLSNTIFGHTKSQWAGMGEPLPSGVAAEWTTYCSGQGYVKTAFGKTIHQHWYDEIDTPSMWVYATDDDIAIRENVDDMLSIFAKLPSEVMELSPSDHGLREIGHMKFFSRKNKQLWSLLTDWLGRF